jgi:DNA excision repair protein ERCC-3
MNSSHKPLFVQSDFTILAESDHPEYEVVRARLGEFAELVKNPGRLHTYRMTRLSLWNAAAAGISAREIVSFLAAYSKFSLPQNIRNDIFYFVDRYGLVRIVEHEGEMYLQSEDKELLQSLLHMPALGDALRSSVDDHHLLIRPGRRGDIKRELIKAGIPVQDLAGFHSGESLDIRWREDNAGDEPFALRDYQQEAIDRFLEPRSGGSGVVVLPCGAGKTIVGIGAITRLRCATLILTTNVTSVRQWKRELLAKTTIDERDIGEYSGTRKEVRPITVATYQILTHRRSKDDPFVHMKLFRERDWGLIIYDEVHLLPAPVFRETAQLQATRRLGLTATLVREDGLEEDVFSLVGPRCYYKSWKTLEERGYISRVACTEIRVPLSPEAEMRYLRADSRSKIRIAAENSQKLEVLFALLDQHSGDQVLIIGQYLDQLRAIASALQVPIITGEMGHEQREQLYERFRQGELTTLVVSKVANFAIDLPDASVAIQVSGSFGSRQEEAQRLGRILRPKAQGRVAYFYSLISDRTRELEFAHKRQLFLVEQGYEYQLSHADEWLLQKRKGMIT